MRRLMTPDQSADGGNPIDSDLHQMTDDGGPQTPDPAWANADWGDVLGEDTFDDGPANVPAPLPLDLLFPPPANSQWQRLRGEIEVRARWRAACERLAPRGT
jgi:hypothetical protein